MKRCPECRRDYYDETLLYCLDDGTALLEGPASGDEPATAILTDDAQPGGPVTRVQTPAGRFALSVPVAVVIAVICVVVVSAVAVALYRFKGKDAPGLSTSRQITRLTNSGTVGSATVSPDGQYVAYSSIDETRRSSLWLRHVKTSSNVQIVPPAVPGIGFGQVTFSPDSNYIYFLRSERNIPSSLYEVPVFGGTPKKVIDDASRISFSPDSSRFAFTRRDQIKGEDDIWIANADGSAEQILAVKKHPSYYLPGLSWSPDGQTIACPIGGWDGGYYRSVAFVGVSDGREKEVQYHRWNTVDRLQWLSDGTGVLTTANDKPTDPSQVWIVPFPTGEARPITNDLNDYHNISLTSDSKTLVTALSDLTANLWVTPLAQPNGGQQITSSKFNGNSGVAWTPDGRIVYVSRDSGAGEIWIIAEDGKGKRQITDDGSAKRYPCVTTDGQSVIFDSYRSGNIQLWKIGLDASDARVLTNGVGFNADCSRGEPSVVYTTFGPGGYRIWKISVDGSDPAEIIDKYASVPSVSPDGKLIACYYVADISKATKLGIFPITGGEPVKVFDLLTNASSGSPPVRWMPDGHSVAYVATQGGVSNIWIQSVDGSSPKQMTDFTNGRIFWFDISRDGKQLALSRGTQTSDVVLMKDF